MQYNGGNVIVTVNRLNGKTIYDLDYIASAWGKKEKEWDRIHCRWKYTYVLSPSHGKKILKDIVTNHYSCDPSPEEMYSWMMGHSKVMAGVFRTLCDRYGVRYE